MSIIVLPPDDPDKVRKSWIVYEKVGYGIINDRDPDEPSKPSEPSSRFICSKHGEVNPTVIYYSCPAQAYCPICNEHMTDELGGIKILEGYAAPLARPSMYTREHLEKLSKEDPEAFPPEQLEEVWQLMEERKAKEVKSSIQVPTKQKNRT